MSVQSNYANNIEWVGTSGGGSGDGIQQNTDTDIGSDVLELDKTFQ